VAAVTLQMTPNDAETLTLANGEGRIQLILRNSSDEGTVKPPGRYVAELYGSPRKPAPVAVAAVRKPVVITPQPLAVPIAPPAPAPPDQSVVIRGTTKTVEVIPRCN